VAGSIDADQTIQSKSRFDGIRLRSISLCLIAFVLRRTGIHPRIKSEGMLRLKMLQTLDVNAGHRNEARLRDRAPDDEATRFAPTSPSPGLTKRHRGNNIVCRKYVPNPGWGTDGVNQYPVPGRATLALTKL
jgi:hypothetical protein